MVSEAEEDHYNPANQVIFQKGVGGRTFIYYDIFAICAKLHFCRLFIVVAEKIKFEFYVKYGSSSAIHRWH